MFNGPQGQKTISDSKKPAINNPHTNKTLFYGLFGYCCNIDNKTDPYATLNPDLI